MELFKFTLFGHTFTASYYGLMYAISFFIGYIILLKRGNFSKKQIEDLFLYIFMGVVLGGRLGYVVFYNLGHYLQHPGEIFKFWEGGMSFHGGLIGVIIAMALFSKVKKTSFLKLADEITLVVPIGLFFGRIGNYLNKELLGYTDYHGPFAVIKDGVSYFPSPLLEALLEGIILFIILYVFDKYKQGKKGQGAALFLVGYGFFRLLVEIFFRQPDAHIGYIAGFLTMGQILSFPMIIVGIISFFYLGKYENK